MPEVIPPTIEDALNPLVAELAQIRQNGISPRNRVMQLNSVIAQAIQICRQFPNHTNYLSTNALLNGKAKYHDVLRHAVFTAMRVRRAMQSVEETAQSPKLPLIMNSLVQHAGVPASIDEVRASAFIGENDPLMETVADLELLRKIIMPHDIDIALHLGASWQELRVGLIDLQPGDSPSQRGAGKPTLTPLVVTTKDASSAHDETDCATDAAVTETTHPAEAARTAMIKRAFESHDFDAAGFGPLRSELIDAACSTANVPPEEVTQLHAALTTELDRMIVSLTRGGTSLSETADTLMFARQLIPEEVFNTPAGTTLREKCCGLALLMNFSSKKQYSVQDKKLLAEFLPYNEDKLKEVFCLPGTPKVAILDRVKEVFKTLQTNLIDTGKLFSFIKNAVEESASSEQEKLAALYVLLHLFQEMMKKEPGKLKHPQTQLVPPVHRLNVIGLAKKVDTNELPQKLWRQQRESVSAVSRGIQTGHLKQYIDAPPGVGKTGIMTALMSELAQQGRVLVMEPTIQMCHQLARRVYAEANVRDVGIIADDSAQFGRHVTIATYTSIQKYIEAGIFGSRDFQLILPDEAHRGISQERAKIFEVFNQAVVVATSASTTDINGKSLSDELDCAYNINFVDGMRAGILNPTRLFAHEAEEDIDVRCKTAFEIFNTEYRRKQTIIIVKNTRRADEVVEHFTSRRVPACAVHSNMKGKNKAVLDIEKAFRKGEFPVLVVCDMLAEGWDYPALANAIMLDVPLAEWEFLQREGRITRLDADKPDSKLSLLYSQQQYKKVAPIVQNTMGINLATHTNGARIVEPEPGYWPANAACF